MWEKGDGEANKSTSMVIGVDFDNTIVGYDKAMHRAALQRGLISPEVARSKKLIRDTIRRLPDGEIEWQKLQALVYGPMMSQAELIDGVQVFFECCKRLHVPVYIISHKTEYANFDETGTSLRGAALQWMKAHRFFEIDGLGLSQQAVFFESTRQDKIDRIKRLACTHFIDDLEETFREETFPTDVEKILYSPHERHTALKDVRVVCRWKDISDYFFNATR